RRAASAALLGERASRRGGRNRRCRVPGSSGRGWRWLAWSGNRGYGSCPAARASRGGLGAFLADADYGGQHPVSDLPLGAFGDLDVPVGSHNGDGVAVGVEADAGLGNVVHHDGVRRLGLELLARVRQGVFGLSGKTDDDLSRLLCAQLGEDILRRLK